MLTEFQCSLTGAIWVDTNTQFNKNNLPDRLPDGLAIIYGSLYNLLSCTPGERGRTFQPEYGSQWHRFLQEPIDNITADQMKISMIQSISRWEPRLKIDFANTSITPDLTLPGYYVKISGIEVISNADVNIKFTEVI